MTTAAWIYFISFVVLDFTVIGISLRKILKQETNK